MKNQKKEFNQTKYVDNYRKKHKAQFNVDLNAAEKAELDNLLKKCNLSKTQFLRNAINILKSDESSIITKNND